MSESLSLSEASLLVLRPAMNAPVLNVDFLPVGPARAAVVIFAEEWGGVALALGIRSNEGGQVAVFRNQQPLGESTDFAAALEPALTLAERMGFLFDEDMVGNGSKGRAQALALWGRLMGDLEMPPAPRAVPPEPAATERVDPGPNDTSATAPMQELVLERVAGEEPAEIRLDVEAPVADPPPAAKPAEPLVRQPAAKKKAAKAKAGKPKAERAKSPGEKKPRDRREAPRVPEAPPVEIPPTPAPVAAAAEEPAEAVVPAVATPDWNASTLSKFRQAPDQAGAEAEAGGSELGRIPLKRVRRSSDGPKRVPYLARLLSSF